MDRIPILIVGGGIGGLTAALALSRAGLAAHVVEQSAEFSEIGAGLQLAPNALRVLDALGVMPEIAKHAVFPNRLVWMDALAEKPITALELGEPFETRFGQPYLVMHRADLLNCLVAACRASPRITLEPNRGVAAVIDRGDWAEVTFADGSSRAADTVIGADGLHSAVRKLIVDDAPICYGYVAYRGTIPIERMHRHAGLDSVVMWIGPDMHFVQYPIRRGELYNQVAVFRSPTYKTGAADWGSVGELDAHFTQTCDYIRGCIPLMWRDKRWAMFDREPILTWTKNRITLLGDAAHPMFQYVAQGACQAIEDGFCLAKHVAGNADRAAALKAYETERAMRTARVQMTARAMGAFFHMQGVPAVVRNDLMARRSSRDYSPLDWLYGHKI